MGTPGEPLRYGDPGLCYDDPRWHWDGVYPAGTLNMNNRISAVLAAQAITNINTAIGTLRTNLPFLITLNAEQRKKMAHGGDKSQGIIQLGLDFAAANPTALPGDFNAVEFAKDGALHDSLENINASVAQLADDLSGTLMLLNSELMLQFLDVYAFARANNRDGRYNTFVNACKAHFNKPSRVTTPTPTPTP